MLSFKRPRLWILLLTALSVASLFSLGQWQLSRAHYKDAILAEMALAQQQPAQPLRSVLGRDDAPEHLRVYGTVTPINQSFLLDNQIRERETGVEVFTPARIEGEPRLVLLARGWLPIDRTTRSMPEVPIIEEAIEVSGRFARGPTPGLSLGGNVLESGRNWPKVLVRLEHSELEAMLGEPLHQRVLWMDLGPHSWPQRFEPVSLPADRHRGYAVQWFGLSAAVLIVFLVLHLRRRPKS